jgi:chemotaxis protein histidine kinase CheA
MAIRVLNEQENFEFCSDCLEACAQVLNHLRVNEGLLFNWLLERLHYLKGNTAVAGFADLADFIHQLESLCRLASEKDFVENIIQTKLFASIEYLNSSYLLIQKSQQYPIAPKTLLGEIKNIIDSAEWINKKGFTSIDRSKDQMKPIVNTVTPTDSYDSLSQQTLRVQREDLDHIQKELKSLQQIRTKLSLFSKQLKSEFQGEPFLRDLDLLISSMSSPLVQAGEVFFKFRAKTFSMLIPKLENITNDTAAELNKNVRLVFNFQTEFLIDQQILSVLDICFSHLIKNSIDHGIEKNGEILVEMNTDCRDLSTQDMLIFKFHDDGRGLNINRIKEKIIAMNILSKSAIERMGPAQIAEFIFLPQLSTKDDVSKISGRGVGMSLIKSELEKISGSIHVVPTDKGTCFEIKVPRCFDL